MQCGLNSVPQSSEQWQISPIARLLLPLSSCFRSVLEQAHERGARHCAPTRATPRDVIEIVIPRPQVLRLARRGMTVMTRSDWRKKN